jgi:hypothetical protein
MVEVVINTCYGGFCLSKKAYEELGIKWDSYGFKYSEDRTNPELIRVVKKLGKDADGECAELKIVKIPNDIEWFIEEYDGNEWVSEKHRIWD